MLEGHVPLALRHHPRLRRYVVNIAEGDPPSADAIDSLPTLDFDTLDDFRLRLYDSPEGEAAVHADVQRFMGPPADAYATEPHVHREPAGEAPAAGARTPGEKWIVALARRPELSHAQFLAAWLDEAVPRALAAQPAARRATTLAVDERLSPAAPDYDAFLELGFARAADARGAGPGWPDAASALALDPAGPACRAVLYRVAEYVQRP